jgi:hypothetical protein
MDDTLLCPICGNKTRNIHASNKLLHRVNKTADYTDRVCSHGRNHIVSMWVDRQTKQIDLLRFSLDAKFSNLVEIDFVNNRSFLICMRNGLRQIIDIPRLLVPDFPDLTQLKSQIGLLLAFS